jgi:predicted nucleic acid-binding protein
MSGRNFLDTNILVYAYDVTDRQKQAVAQDLVMKAVAGELVISTQVLAEFASTLLHKIAVKVSNDEVIAALDALSPIALVKPDHEIVRRAVEAQATYGLHFYDGMIVAAAERAGCEKIWSEDLNTGQEYFGVIVANPFA